MFGFSLSEIILLAVIALVVIGPKQLPEVARTLGRFLNDLKRTSNSFTREFRDHVDSVKVEPIRFDDPKKPAAEATTGPVVPPPQTAPQAPQMPHHEAPLPEYSSETSATPAAATPTTQFTLKTPETRSDD